MYLINLLEWIETSWRPDKNRVGRLHAVLKTCLIRIRNRIWIRKKYFRIHRQSLVQYTYSWSCFYNNVRFVSARDGWGYCYAGARATYGFTTGKVWYEVKVMENLEVRVEKDPTTFDIRIGWSTDESGMMLGKLSIHFSRFLWILFITKSLGFSLSGWFPFCRCFYFFSCL